MKIYGRRMDAAGNVRCADDLTECFDITFQEGQHVTRMRVRDGVIEAYVDGQIIIEPITANSVRIKTA